jgi:hypothetical protein
LTIKDVPVVISQ